MGRKPRRRIADLVIAGIAAANRLPLFHRQPVLPGARIRRDRRAGAYPAKLPPEKSTRGGSVPVRELLPHRTPG